MDRDDTQFWAGVILFVLGGFLLFAPLVMNWRYTDLLLAVAVLGLAVGALLVGVSGRGRPV
ncbi:MULTISPECIES: hypothetical protein [Halorussus]|uniref:hypothetical protein n=1 Tax=Halorussus TaxID=1070314 RepID=UPI00209EA9E8|nr:hypothetical protein [Halorussus vallis]USZ76114.1 hypothetical protein NGM07_02025 [Halorussus vallis]